MQNSDSFSLRTAAFLEERSAWVILATVVVTALLVFPLLTMAPDENASENPGGQVFDLQDDIDDRFAPAVHSAGLVVESRGDDILTQKALLELYENTQMLRQADQAGELAPGDLEAQSFLFSFYFTELERPVLGIYSLADEVHELMASDPLIPTLADASDDDVKLVLHRILSDPAKRRFREDLSVNPNPPKDTDGRREDSGRGWVRELQGRWPGVLG